MTRVILNSVVPQLEVPILSSKISNTTKTFGARLRHCRSSTYVDAIEKLDAGSHMHNRSQVNDLLEAIRQEFPEISIEQLSMLGIVARCHLGAPYEVHTLECSGEIIQHYKTRQSLPGLLESARTLALNPNYAFIEVYPDHLVAVAGNGKTSLIQR